MRLRATAVLVLTLPLLVHGQAPPTDSRLLWQFDTGG